MSFGWQRIHVMGVFSIRQRMSPNFAECLNNKNRRKLLQLCPLIVSLVMSIALSAQTTKAQVDVHIYDYKCFEGWPVLRRIKIKQVL